MGLIWLFVDFVELLGLVSALFWLLVIYFVIDVAFFVVLRPLILVVCRK
jgi:hypothetical protein